MCFAAAISSKLAVCFQLNSFGRAFTDFFALRAVQHPSGWSHSQGFACQGAGLTSETNLPLPQRDLNSQVITALFILYTL